MQPSYEAISAPGERSLENVRVLQPNVEAMNRAERTVQEAAISNVTVLPNVRQPLDDDCVGEFSYVLEDGRMETVMEDQESRRHLQDMVELLTRNPDGHAVEIEGSFPLIEHADGTVGFGDFTLFVINADMPNKKPTKTPDTEASDEDFAYTVDSMDSPMPEPLGPEVADHSQEEPEVPLSEQVGTSEAFASYRSVEYFTLQPGEGQTTVMFMDGASGDERQETVDSSSRAIMQRMLERMNQLQNGDAPETLTLVTYDPAKREFWVTIFGREDDGRMFQELTSYSSEEMRANRGQFGAEIVDFQGNPLTDEQLWVPEGVLEGRLDRNKAGEAGNPYGEFVINGQITPFEDVVALWRDNAQFSFQNDERTPLDLDEMGAMFGPRGTLPLGEEQESEDEGWDAAAFATSLFEEPISDSPEIHSQPSPEPFRFTGPKPLLSPFGYSSTLHSRQSLEESNRAFETTVLKIMSYVSTAVPERQVRVLPSDSEHTASMPSESTVQIIATVHPTSQETPIVVFIPDALTEPPAPSALTSQNAKPEPPLTTRTPLATNLPHQQPKPGDHSLGTGFHPVFKPLPVPVVSGPVDEFTPKTPVKLNLEKPDPAPKALKALKALNSVIAGGDEEPPAPPDESLVLEIPRYVLEVTALIVPIADTLLLTLNPVETVQQEEVISQEIIHGVPFQASDQMTVESVTESVTLQEATVVKSEVKEATTRQSAHASMQRKEPASAPVAQTRSLAAVEQPQPTFRPTQFKEVERTVSQIYKEQEKGSQAPAAPARSSTRSASAAPAATRQSAPAQGKQGTHTAQPQATGQQTATKTTTHSAAHSAPTTQASTTRSAAQITGQATTGAIQTATPSATQTVTRVRQKTVTRGVLHEQALHQEAYSQDAGFVNTGLGRVWVDNIQLLQKPAGIVSLQHILSGIPAWKGQLQVHVHAEGRQIYVDIPGVSNRIPVNESIDSRIYRS